MSGDAAAEAVLRPLEADDVGAARRLAFRALAGWVPGLPEQPPADVPASRSIPAHVHATDPDGCWAAELGGDIVGVALALRREALWVLSLLVVDPAHQAAGVGRRLLERALAYGDDARARMIMSSNDPRAQRRYVLAGLALRPTVALAGRVRRTALPAVARVRDGGERDLPMTDAIDRALRGAPHGPDIPALLADGMAMLVVPNRGYVVHSEGSPRLLAATDALTAQTLLWAALGEADADAGVHISGVTGDQAWAIEAGVEAGLAPLPEGGLFVGGEPGPLTPYIPSGPYL